MQHRAKHDVVTTWMEGYISAKARQTHNSIGKLFSFSSEQHSASELSFLRRKITVKREASTPSMSVSARESAGKTQSHTHNQFFLRPVCSGYRNEWRTHQKLTVHARVMAFARSAIKEEEENEKDQYKNVIKEKGNAATNGTKCSDGARTAVAAGDVFWLSGTSPTCLHTLHSIEIVSYVGLRK